MPSSLKIDLVIGGRNLEVDSEIPSFVYYESLEGSATFSIHLSTKQQTKLDSIVTGGEAQSMRLRISYEQPDGTDYGDWKNIRIDQVKYRYFSDATEVVITGTDAGIVLAERCHKNVFVEKRVSDMVRTIATQNGMTAEVEPTKDVYTFYQCGLSDGAFIREVLMPVAVTAGGMGDYRFYVKNGDILVFSPPDLKKSNELGEFSIFDFSSEGGEVFSTFDVDFRKIHRGPENHYSFEMRGFDVSKKEAVVWTADDNTVPYKKLAQRSPEAPDVPSRIGMTVEPDLGYAPPGKVKQEAIAGWSKNARSFFQTQLSMSPNVTASPGRIVGVKVRDADGNLHFSTGQWLVGGVLTKRKSGTAATVLHLERRTYHGHA